jgi:hypothetical protein
MKTCEAFLPTAPKWVKSSGPQIFQVSRLLLMHPTMSG